MPRSRPPPLLSPPSSQPRPTRAVAPAARRVARCRTPERTTHSSFPTRASISGARFLCIADFGLRIAKPNSGYPIPDAGAQGRDREFWTQFGICTGTRMSPGLPNVSPVSGILSSAARSRHPERIRSPKSAMGRAPLRDCCRASRSRSIAGTSFQLRASRTCRRPCPWC